MTVQHEITQRDLRSRSGEIMSAVEHGETFVVTRSGTPIGELIPLRQRRVVSRAEFAAMSDAAMVVDAEKFRADVDSAMESEVLDPYER